jgi:tRNA (cmo5U34)-methyltransferase
MNTERQDKSSVDEIRARFDADVERFANLETGQSATVDAPLVMELIVRAATASTPHIRRVLDVGCGAGNLTLKLLEAAPDFDADLLDLSGAMLARARERVGARTSGHVRTIEGDLRTAPLESGRYDVVLAAAVLHHLRDDADWERAFSRLFDVVAPGGSLWISDLVAHEDAGVQRAMWDRYGDYLAALGGPEYRDKVFAYIDVEDSPRPVTYQLDLLRRVGFARVDLLHKNGCFAAFGAIKA